MAAILVGLQNGRIKILKGDHPRTASPKFGPNWPSSFRGNILPIFSIFCHGSHLGWLCVVIGYNSKREPSKDHLCQVWSKLANGFRGGLKEGDLRTI